MTGLSTPSGIGAKRFNCAASKVGRAVDAAAVVDAAAAIAAAEAVEIARAGDTAAVAGATDGAGTGASSRFPSHADATQADQAAPTTSSLAGENPGVIVQAV